jgi:hypothetical protein
MHYAFDTAEALDETRKLEKKNKVKRLYTIIQTEKNWTLR